ncbi:phasin family protein [Lacibacterium aquatile]|uniref:Phasin family protein n=1 Tax=Lacibacterium aquatile TaxID=1168082 RepID=A0ABW5DML2_9PROT
MTTSPKTTVKRPAAVAPAKAPAPKVAPAPAKAAAPAAVKAVAAVKKVAKTVAAEVAQAPTAALTSPAALPAPAALPTGEDIMTSTTQAFETSFTAAKAQFEKTTATLFGSYEEFTTFGKDNVEAFVKAQTAFVKGSEEIGKTLAALSQANYEAALATSKAFFGATTFNQVVDLQNEVAKTSFDKLVAEGTKVSELVQKVANEVVEPLKARVDVAISKATKAA